MKMVSKGFKDVKDDFKTYYQISPYKVVFLVDMDVNCE